MRATASTIRRLPGLGVAWGLWLACAGALTACTGRDTGDTGDTDTGDTGAWATFDFAESDQGFVAVFADYPVSEDEFYEIDAEHADRPDGPGRALRITGNNHSDDLFMGFVRRVDGLAPSTAHEATFRVEVLSQYPTGSIGIGGSPADSVYLKAGATAVEPVAVDTGGSWVLNVDKGNQAGGGADAVVLGTIATPTPDDWSWQAISRDNASALMSVTTASDGSVWLLFGTDSGFEGTTELYYLSVTVELSPTTGR